MTLRPLTDRVLIRRIDAETITKFGIVIPDILTTKSDQGIVVAVGPGRYTDTGILIPVESIVALGNPEKFPANRNTLVPVETVPKYKLPCPGINAPEFPCTNTYPSYPVPKIGTFIPV